ncbi:hypothetical protein JZ785_25330 [Alicyclobacillus curvatus]|jgi:hypothetical protein|nr:hypothetical protein JZ785_25330 [Alicyclobacillus curvatus]
MEAHTHAHAHNTGADWTAKDISQLLEVVADRVPDLLMKLFKILYSEESAKEMGRAVGGLYKELANAGIPQEMALKMASDYMFAVKDITKIVNQHHDGQN